MHNYLKILISRAFTCNSKPKTKSMSKAEAWYKMKSSVIMKIKVSAAEYPRFDPNFHLIPLKLPLRSFFSGSFKFSTEHQHEMQKQYMRTYNRM